MQMTEHIMLLRDANTCSTWYNTTTVEASCALSRCSKQINSLSVQSRYNAVEAWIVQRHRSHVRSKAVEHRRSVPKQRSVRRSCCGSLRGCWRRWRGRRPRPAQLGGGGGHQKHRHRKLLARLRKRSHWPREYCAGHPRVDAEHASGRGATSAVFADSQDPRCHRPALG